ncbi:MAG TPA: Calx-beta domain-containing protein [Pyrinomonadaceae bacterium]|jgi:hypothetical protein
MSQTINGRTAATLPRRMLARALFALLACAALAGPTAAQSLNAGSPDLVITQVYARGGEPGASYRNDYVEIFNRGNTTIDLGGYSVQVVVNAPPQPGGGFPGGLTTLIRMFTAQGVAAPLEPGRYRLLAYGSSGENGNSVPADSAPADDYDMPADFGRVAIVRGVTPVVQFGCPTGADAAVVDFFSYGATTCAEGPAVVAAPTATTAATRNNNGCADTDNNAADFAVVAPNPHPRTTPAGPCNLAAPASTVQFEAAAASVNEEAGGAEIFVTRTGDTSGAASVRYATSSSIFPFGIDRSRYTTAFGTVNFAAGETRKSFRVLVTDDLRADQGKRFYLGLANPSGAALGATHIMQVTITDNDAGQAVNPIDSTDFFVRQHYADFLSREPDAPGRTFWTNEIESCGADAQCREVKRINVSAAFFLSIEFQDTGFFAYRAHRAAFPDDPVSRPRGFPTYRELLRDAQQIGSGVVVGQNNWQQQLAANKQAYALEFVQRSGFLIRYPQGLTAAQFVDNLNATAGNPLSQAERDQQVANLNAAGNSTAGRAAVLAAVVEDTEFKNAEFNRAFVLAEYVGYLRRSPFDTPITDATGYDFWLGKLNEFNGDYIRAEMVKAFISSDEYRNRFTQ